MVGTLYVTRGYQGSGPYMQHKVSNGRTVYVRQDYQQSDSVCNMTLPTVGCYM